MKWMILILGGALGTLTRYGLSTLALRWWGSRFPYGTLLVNILGCFIIGAAAAFSAAKFSLNPQWRLFLMAGFCGALTTFSTFILETDLLVKDIHFLAALMNILCNITFCFFVFKGGILLGEWAGKLNF